MCSGCQGRATAHNPPCLINRLTRQLVQGYGICHSPRLYIKPLGYVWNSSRLTRNLRIGGEFQYLTRHGSMPLSLAQSTQSFADIVPILAIWPWV